MSLKDLESLSILEEHKINEHGAMEINRKGSAHIKQSSVMIPKKTEAVMNQTMSNISPIKEKSIKLENVENLYEMYDVNEISRPNQDIRMVK